MYENHEAIQKGIQGFAREKLFLTSKLTLEQVDPSHIQTSVEKACDVALQELGTDYLDLYLIHWPHDPELFVKTFRAMEHLVERGKIRYAGVSNCTIHHLQDLLREGYKPAANQVEFHPYLYQKSLLDFCRSHNIELIAYRPFGKQKLLEEELFAKIGQSYNKTPGQVILRWLVQKHIPVIPKAGSEKHLREDLDIFDFSLSAVDMENLDKLNKNYRFCMPEDPAFTY